MSELGNIVNITITKGTTAVDQANFGIPMIIDEFLTSKTTVAFTRARLYTSLSAMITDGWTTSDAVYKAVASMKAQNPSPVKWYVGRLDSGDTDVATGLSAIALENNGWYFGVLVGTTGDTLSKQTSFASWFTSQKKIGFIQGTHIDIADGTKTTDIAAVIKTANNERCTVIYHLASNINEYANAAWVGNCAPFDPGSQTWAFKQLLGVSSDAINSSQISAVHTKNANTFTTVGGVGITRFGTTGKGEYIDIVRGTDWIESRIQEAVFGQLINNRKVPYDDTGITLIGAAVDSVLKEAERKGILQSGTSKVNLPKYADILQADKTARKLPNITFSGLYEGAVHTTTINGTLSL